MVVLHVELEAQRPTEEIIMVGSHEALGWWDPSKGFKLVWTGECWENAHSQPFVLEGSDTGGAQGAVDYKFVRSGTSDGPRWESGRNRVLACAPSGEADMLLTAIFDTTSSNVRPYPDAKKPLVESRPSRSPARDRRLTHRVTTSSMGSSRHVGSDSEWKSKYQTVARGLADFRSRADVERQRWRQDDRSAREEEESLRRELFIANADLQKARQTLAAVAAAAALGPARPSVVQQSHTIRREDSFEVPPEHAGITQQTLVSSYDLARRLRSMAGSTTDVPPPSARHVQRVRTTRAEQASLYMQGTTSPSSPEASHTSRPTQPPTGEVQSAFFLPSSAVPLGDAADVAAGGAVASANTGRHASPARIAGAEAAAAAAAVAARTPATGSSSFADATPDAITPSHTDDMFLRPQTAQHRPPPASVPKLSLQSAAVVASPVARSTEVPVQSRGSGATDALALSAQGSVSQTVAAVVAAFHGDAAPERESAAEAKSPRFPTRSGLQSPGTGRRSPRGELPLQARAVLGKAAQAVPAHARRHERVRAFSPSSMFSNQRRYSGIGSPKAQPRLMSHRGSYEAARPRLHSEASQRSTDGATGPQQETGPTS
eukprot:TRINITY_DN9037_c0_g1_i1.p1 TRINITY_DN9037_c0_g1~~TRINITY_DN9037_c0_g1_i1.p1  ORF type:complete len:603 (-),score=36.01 TRINITY_DN9037_c0_g1_i1:299-2107(-)